MKRTPITHFELFYVRLNSCSAGKITDVLEMAFGPNWRFCDTFPRWELLLLSPFPLWRKLYFELRCFQILRDPLESGKISCGQTIATNMHSGIVSL